MLTFIKSIKVNNMYLEINSANKKLMRTIKNENIKKNYD
ncbi:hypothetical protein NIES4103_15000 [Nostoc sp. NIES-4103]|nr:hypothetical protein NIES4103_15000 [Nostoc sp. NIES-4103]